MDGSVSNGIAKLFRLIESQRGLHTGSGNMFFWDSTNGNDGDDGLTEATAKLTFAGVNALVVAHRHDIILAVPGASGQTVITEKIELDKAFTFLRGPGRDFAVIPTVSGASTVILSAIGCELSGCIIKTHTVGSADAIEVTADFAHLHNIWVEDSQGHGIALNGASQCVIHDFIVQDAAKGGSGHGLHIDGTSGNAKRNKIHSGIFQSCLGDAIEIKGVNATDNFIYGGPEGLFINDTTGWGIIEKESANRNFITGPTVQLANNSLGNIKLIGAVSKATNIEQWHRSTGSGAYTVTIELEELAGTPKIPSAVITIKDSGDTTTLAQLTSNGSGIAVFTLDDGTYTVHIQKPGSYTFDIETLVVSGNTSDTYIGTPLSVSAPASPDMCKLFISAYTSGGNVITSGLEGTVKLNTPFKVGGISYGRSEQVFQYESEYWFVVVPKTAIVDIVIGTLGKRLNNVTVPNEDIYDIDEF
jgi:hypothetical protein